MIREARHDDIVSILKLGEQMHAESKFSAHPWAEGRVESLLVNGIDDPYTLVLVAEREGAIIGGFAGYITPHWAVDALTAGDYWLFVAPEHRGGLDAVVMLRKYTKWARSHTVPDDLITLGITTHVNVEQSARLYAICGFAADGPLFALGGDA